MKHLEERLQTIAEKRNEQQQIETHLRQVNSRLVELHVQLANYKTELEELDANMSKEEPSNLIAFVSKILGSNEDQGERERQTFLLTHLNYKNCLDRIKTKEYEVDVLETKLAGFKGVEDQYQRLIAEKKSQLKFRNKTLATELILLETAIRSHAYQEKQIQEASAIGKELKEYLVSLYNALVDLSAINYLEATEMRNHKTGILVPIKKIRQAKSLQQTLQIISRLCDRFVEELVDVNDRFNLDYTPFTDRISTFLEYFYDGFISDWIRRSELKVCLAHIDTTLAKVDRIHDMLEGDLEKTKEQQEINHAKLEKIVLRNEIH